MKRGVENLVLATINEGDTKYAVLPVSFHGGHTRTCGDDGFYPAYEMNAASLRKGILPISLGHNTLSHDHISSKRNLHAPVMGAVEFKVHHKSPGHIGEIIVGARNDDPTLLETLSVAANTWRSTSSKTSSIDSFAKHLETSFPGDKIDKLAFVAPHLDVISGFPVIQAVMRAKYGFWDITPEHLNHPFLKERLSGVEIFNGTLPQDSNIRSVEIAKRFPNATPLANPDSHYIDGLNTALNLAKVELDGQREVTTKAIYEALDRGDMIPISGFPLENKKLPFILGAGYMFGVKSADTQLRRLVRSLIPKVLPVPDALGAAKKALREYDDPQALFDAQKSHRYGWFYLDRKGNLSHSQRGALYNR